MLAFGLWPHRSCGTPATSLAVPGGRFSPNRLFLGLGLLWEAPCDCSNSAAVMAETWVSGLCLHFLEAQAKVSLLLSKVSSEKIDQMHVKYPGSPP